MVGFMFLIIKYSLLRHINIVNIVARLNANSISAYDTRRKTILYWAITWYSYRYLYYFNNNFDLIRYDAICIRR